MKKSELLHSDFIHILPIDFGINVLNSQLGGYRESNPDCRYHKPE